LWAKFHPEILRVPEWGRQTREGWIKSAVKREYLENGIADTAKVTIND